MDSANNVICFRNALFALHQKYLMKAGGFLINDFCRRLSKMASPATPKEVNNNLDDTDDDIDEGEEQVEEIICEISPKVTYAGEGLEQFVKGRRFKSPAVGIGEEVE